MNKNIIIAVLAVALLGLSVVSLSNGQLILGATGDTVRQKTSFMEGLFFGTTRQANLARDGSFSTTGTFTLGSTGTAADLLKCGTATWDPPSISSSTPSSTPVTVSGAALGDTVLVGSSVSPQTLKIVGHVTTTDTLVVTFFQPADSAAVNLATTTVRACALSF